MRKQLSEFKGYFFGFLAILLISYGAFAQDPKPSPSPSPTPAAEKPVVDVQEVQPEEIKGVPEIAPEYKSQDRALPDLGRVGVDMMQQKPISLKEVIVLALENNKDIEVSRQNVKIAEFDFQAAGGAYDPRLNGASFFERATTPNISIFNQSKTTTNNTYNGNIRYEGLLRNFGTSYRAEFSSQRLTTDNTISPLSPQYGTSFSIGITQPLRRGRGFDAPRRAVEIAKRNLSLTDTQFRQKSIDIITTVQRAYWDLTFALRNLQVQRDGVRDAKDQLEHNKRLVKEGVLAPIDIVAAETQVANFEQSVYTALDDVNRAENFLKNLISQNKDDALWSYSIIPTDPVDLDAPRTTLTEALDVALQNRPEIELNTVAKDINQIDQRFYKEQTKSQIDLVTSYTVTGIAGKQNPLLRSPFGNQPITVSPDLTGSYNSAASDLLANRYPDFRVGIQFNLPFGNKTAKAQLGKSLVERDRLQTQREQLEQLIQVDVRNALQSVRTAEARLRSSAISRENSEKQYASEQRKLDAGQSNIYLVLERQTALMNARSGELRAQTELNKAIAELQRATGNSLKANNVEARLRK